MTTQVVDVPVATWTALPEEDYFTAQNITNYRVMIVASATEPTEGTIGHWIEPGKTAGSLDALKHWVWCAQGASIAFTADSR